MIPFTYVTTKEQLENVCEKIEKAKEIAIDFECENNLHHYGVYLSLIQVSYGKEHWIIDVLQLKDISCLLTIFEKNNIQKILHDVSFDLRIIDYQYHCKFKNVFDTQLAATFLGKKNLSLRCLLKEYFNVDKQEKFQMADWTRRPLSLEMLEYALKDILYLISLRNKLKEELIKINRFSWVEEELMLLESKDFSYEQGTFFDLSGLHSLTDEQRSVLYTLFMLREKFAKIVDRPIHFIMNSKKMRELAVNLPNTKKEWEELKEVHPIVKKNSSVYYEMVQKALMGKKILSEKEKKYYTPKQKVLFQRLIEVQKDLALTLNLPSYIIMNKDQMQQIVLTKTFNSLHKWQRGLIELKVRID